MASDQNLNDTKQMKNGKQQRNFGCPCGKTYLSYPALFTHVKQKHGGKAPGNLIKPKSQKARGRPRINSVSNDSDGQQQGFNIHEQLINTLQNVNTTKQYKLELTQGRKTCNDMMSSFLNAYELNGEQKNALLCFINYVRTVVEQKYEDKDYWTNESPADIIDISNVMIQDLPNYSQEYPFQKQTLVNMVYILFKWMYKNRWTDHKLVKRNSSESSPPVARSNNQSSTVINNQL